MSDDYDEGGRRKKGRGIPGCLAVLVAVALLGGGLYFGVTTGVDLLKERLDNTAADYPGPGTGKVLFEVQEGDTASDIGRGLKDKGVVESVQAFINAASADERSRGIQVGFYQLKKQMRAADALELLVDPANLMIDTVTIPEGLRVVDILDILEKKTKFPRAAYERALASPAKLGLPRYARGNPEGYLFPSTYNIGPKDTAATLLRAMVDKWRATAEETGLAAAGQRLGKTPAEMMIIASLVEAEGRGDAMPKIARVILNRLDGPGDQGGTNGRLQIDATVNYALGRTGVVAVTTDETQNTDSPYNTYRVVGLPPTPIEAPGAEAMAAAANPAEGDWYYYVTVDLKTGETKFTDSYDEFLQFKAEYKAYCETSDAC